MQNLHHTLCFWEKVTSSKQNIQTNRQQIQRYIFKKDANLWTQLTSPIVEDHINWNQLCTVHETIKLQIKNIHMKTKLKWWLGLRYVIKTVLTIVELCNFKPRNLYCYYIYLNPSHACADNFLTQNWLIFRFGKQKI
jgi:hypothetical protein